ncbi:hypothetical protein ACT21L_000113 [Vibrio vulnificus]|nr:hypothetical protein [Vibrio vulnificus]ELI3521928.1 hypothetical protein [Vibrio vulnificus]
MSEALRVIGAKLATLNNDDASWVVKNLPEHVSAELSAYVKEFSELIKANNQAVSKEIDDNFCKGYKRAIDRETRLDYLSRIYATLERNDTDRALELLPKALIGELKKEFGWSWLPEYDHPVSKTSTYFKEQYLGWLLTTKLGKE